MNHRSGIACLPVRRAGFKQNMPTRHSCRSPLPLTRLPSPRRPGISSKVVYPTVFTRFGCTATLQLSTTALVATWGDSAR